MSEPIEQKSFMEQQIGVDLIIHDIRVLIKAIELPEKTKSGLYTPESVRNAEEREQHIGLILGMGPKAFTPVEEFGEESVRKVGDWVMYGSYERDSKTINGHKCYFINDKRIYCKIKEKDLNKLIPELDRYK